MDEFEDSDDEDDEELLSPILVPEVELPPSHGSGTEDHSMTLVDSNPADSDNQDTDAHSSDVPVLRDLSINTARSTRQEPAPDASKLTVVVRDTAYSTFRAMLYYIYTDNVVFAPLSSSFLSPTADSSAMPVEPGPATPSEGPNNPMMPSISKRFSGNTGAVSSRAEWIREWKVANPDRPAPCSAKSMYRIADRFELWELKERAAAHIIKSLTVENIAYEVFSPFAAAFSTIRKAEVEFFLSHWHEIRSSEAMKNVWLQIRNGRHPGFEEVWPIIAQSLEFKPISTSTSPPARNQDGSE